MQDYSPLAGWGQGEGSFALRGASSPPSVLSHGAGAGDHGWTRMTPDEHGCARPRPRSPAFPVPAPLVRHPRESGDLGSQGRTLHPPLPGTDEELKAVVLCGGGDEVAPKGNQPALARATIPCNCQTNLSILSWLAAPERGTTSVPTAVKQSHEIRILPDHLH